MFNLSNRTLKIIVLLLLIIIASLLLVCSKQRRLKIKYIKNSQHVINKLIVDKDTIIINNTPQGFPMFVDRKDELISNFLINGLGWQPGLSNILRKIVKPGNNVLHLGAHIGYEDIIIAKILGSEGRLYTFEPNERSFNILRKNIFLNEVQDIINIYQKGAWSSNETKKLCFDYFNTGAATLRETEFSLCNDVELVKIDDEIGNIVKKIDILFMDIEGAEIHAMQGAQRILENSPDCIIIMEWSLVALKALSNDTESFMQDKHQKNYKFYEILDPRKGYKEVSLQELLSMHHENIIDVIIVPPSVNLEDLMKL